MNVCYSSSGDVPQVQERQAPCTVSYRRRGQHVVVSLGASDYGYAAGWWNKLRAWGYPVYFETDWESGSLTRPDWSS